MNKVLVVMPAYNEELSIGKVIDDIRGLNLPLDILVINDGSSDNTESVAKKHGAKVLNLHYNSGYGAACQTGFKYAARNDYEYLLQMDSDGQHRADDIPLVLTAIKEEKSDIVIGSRFLEKNKYKLGLLKNIAIRIFRFAIHVSTGNVITDPSSGFQGLNRRAFEFYAKMDNYPEDYPDADVIIRMILVGFNVREIPATFKNREKGVSMHSGLKPIYYMLKMVLSILLVIFREKLIKKAKKV